MHSVFVNDSSTSSADVRPPTASPLMPSETTSGLGADGDLMTASTQAPTSLDSVDSAHTRSASASGSNGSGAGGIGGGVRLRQGVAPAGLRLSLALGTPGLRASGRRDGAAADAESDVEIGLGPEDDDAASDVSGVSGLSGAAHSALLRNMHEPEPADEQLDAELDAALELHLPASDSFPASHELFDSFASPSADSIA